MAAEGGTLRRYHEATKHSYASVRSSPHALDWANKPLPFKVYTGLEGLRPPDDLGRLCLLSNGVLRWRYAGGEPYGFRAAPCTGALYHVDLYLATADRADLAAGLYHYGAHDHALRRLRPDDVRGTLLHASGGFAPLASAPIVLLLTSTFWRNSWKYRARAYRHVYWDAGVILANILALTAAEGLRTAVVMGFVDGEVNHLLGVDSRREAAVALVAIGDGVPAPPAAASLPRLVLATRPLSPHEVRYPEIEQAHRASSLASAGAVAAWRAGIEAAPPTVPAALFGRQAEDVIRSRRSARRFGRGAIGLEQLEAALAAGMEPVAGDSFPAGLVEPFLIVNAVDGLEPGCYGPGLRLIRAGDFRMRAGELALGQALGTAAAANVYFMSNLDAVFDRLGERGYRLAQMAGGIAGGRLELTAVASGLGATGLTFFDNEVTRFFNPASAGRQVMYLAALGRSPAPS